MVVFLASSGAGAAIAIVILLIRIVIWIANSQSGGGGGPQPTTSSISLTCRRNTVRNDEGDSFPVAEVIMNGLVLRRTVGPRASLRMSLLDVTDSGTSPKPVRCLIPSLADHAGHFTWNHDFEIDGQGVRFSSQELAAIPVFALVAERRGRRKLRVQVVVADARSKPVLRATGHVHFEQEIPGPGDLAGFRQETDRRLATLALAVSAMDQSIDKEETDAIKAFFAEHAEDGPEGVRRRKQLNEVMAVEWRRLEAGEERPSAIRFIATRLELDEGFVREVHDRYLRAAMFEENALERSIGMPTGLSEEAKLDYLNGEYSRWRTRVTHRDPAKAQEAEERIKIIVRLRRDLTRV
jgi:hypothetical protein